MMVTIAKEVPLVQLLGSLLWPSFLAACAAEFVFFGLLDPMEVLQVADDPPISAIGAYTLGFFCFWLLCIISSWGSIYLLSSPDAAKTQRSDSA